MKFSRIFRGRASAYGLYVIKKKQGEKLVGSAKTISKNITEKCYTDHLQGKQSLGVVPLTEDSTCWFGALDIDVYPIDFKELERKIDKVNLPLVVCRTKSGGAHLYMFFKSQIPAIFIRQKLRSFAAVLGYPKAEMFPGQDSNDEIDQGSWINLPYFDHKSTTRWAYVDGMELSLKEFLVYAEENMVTEKELREINPPILLEIGDAPPCLQRMCKEGIVKGQKDTSLFNLAVYCKMKYPQEWEKQLEELNRRFVHPPATSQTIIKVVKPHKKKEYFYTCDNYPLSAHCDKAVCKKLQYGIGHEQPSIHIGKLVKIKSNPPVWYLEVESGKLELTTDDMMSQIRFRKLCVERFNIIPKLLKEKTWNDVVQDRLDNLEEIEAPEDASPEGQFYYLLKVFCTELPQAREVSEILQHKPFTEEGRTYFQSPDYLAYLQQKKFLAFKPNKVFALIKEIGGGKHIRSIKGVRVRLWSIPSYDKQTEDYDKEDLEGEY